MDTLLCTLLCIMLFQPSCTLSCSPDAMAAMRYKAYGLIEGFKIEIVQKKGEISALEEKKIEYAEELTVLGKQSVDSINVFSAHSSERFGVIQKTQSMVGNLLVEAKASEVS